MSILFTIFVMFLFLAIIGVFYIFSQKSKPLLIVLIFLSALIPVAGYFIYQKLDYIDQVNAAERVVRTEVHEVEVINVKRPKHYSVTFKDLNTGETVKLNIGKHCNTHQMIQENQKHKLAVSIRTNPMINSEREYPVYVDAKIVFCPKG